MWGNDMWGNNMWGNDMFSGSEILLQARDQKIKFTEVEVHCRYDFEDCSSEHPFIHGPKALFMILGDMRYRRPLYYFTVPGMLMGGAGLFRGLKFLQDFYHGDSLFFGPTLLMMLLTIVGMFMAFTGIILHAMSRTITDVR